MKLRRKSKEDGEDVEEIFHHTPDNGVARLETLVGEEHLGEKPPWEYVIEEENS